MWGKVLLLLALVFIFEYNPFFQFLFLGFEFASNESEELHMRGLRALIIFNMTLLALNFRLRTFLWLRADPNNTDGLGIVFIRVDVIVF